MRRQHGKGRKRRSSWHKGRNVDRAWQQAAAVIPDPERVVDVPPGPPPRKRPGRQRGEAL